MKESTSQKSKLSASARKKRGKTQFKFRKANDFDAEPPRCETCVSYVKTPILRGGFVKFTITLHACTTALDMEVKPYSVCDLWCCKKTGEMLDTAQNLG